MAEQIAAHISLNPYADNMSPVLNYKVKTGFQNIDAKKHQCPDDKQPQVFIGDIVIDDILGNDRVKRSKDATIKAQVISRIKSFRWGL